MDIKYVYTVPVDAPRRPCFFSERSDLLVDIVADESLAKDWDIIHFQETGIQCGPEMAAHEVSTEDRSIKSRGVQHKEGGWPKDINPEDMEQVSRYKKKIEKDDNYIKTISRLGSLMEHYMKQNNAIDIYEEYFSSNEVTEDDDPSKESYARTVNVFKDPSFEKRNVAYVSWCPEDSAKLAVAYCSFQLHVPSISSTSFIWDLESPLTPKSTLFSASPPCCIEYCPKDMNVLIGGCYNGQIVLWDVRTGGDPVDSSSHDCSHSGAIYGVSWLHSKGASECFSVGSDGQVMWWDVRKLSEPNEVLLLDPSRGQHPCMENSYSATCLEYEPTMPTRFMVGTEEGSILAGNRKATEKLTAVFSGHKGPVYSIQRNPLLPKNFVSAGDYSVRVWSEDVKESSILTLGCSRTHITDARWSPTRPSVILATKETGELNIWDVLYDHTNPLLTVQVSSSRLSCIRLQEHQNAVLAACGSEEGFVYLLDISAAFSKVEKNDKTMLTSMLERETHREKTLEARHREERLKERISSGDQQQNTQQSTSSANESEDDLLSATAREFFAAVNS